MDIAKLFTKSGFSRHAQALLLQPLAEGTGDVALPIEMTVEQAEQLLHLARLRQRVAIEPHRLGLGHATPRDRAPENALSGHRCAMPCRVLHER